MKKKQILPIICYIAIILYLELFLKYIITKQLFNLGTIYLILFTIPVVLLITLITKCFKPKANRIISIIIMTTITLLFIVQYVYFTLFSVPFSFSSIGMADQALDFVSIIKDTLLKYWYNIIAIIFPLVLFIVLNKKINYEQITKKKSLALLSSFIILYLSSFTILIPNEQSSKQLYFNVDNPIAIIDRFGMLTYTKIDIKRQLFGYESEILIDIDYPTTPENPEPEEIIYKDNVLDIDFEAKKSNKKAIQQINDFISKQEPTSQNQYTGMFKGKNLIFILAEGFNEIAVDETRTPTLYKLVNEGFVFNNFYSPVHLSTTGGEFQATTGLIPTQESLTLWKKEKPTIAYALGNAFNNIGYRTQAYHDWTYSYYKRQVTMKTLGFNDYLGCGNGLEKEINCGWLPYDTDMINVTTPKYLGQEGNFMTYYVTVSGHSPYNSGSRPARRYLSEVTGDYSYAVKCYLASQMELDRAVEQLIKNLEESGELENTVIALVGDHYPYTLSANEINEVSTYKKDGVIEVNKSNFIIWNSEITEPIIVDKLGSQIDVLPTLLNLFGIEYDSRLILGKDILSNGECLAIFSNYSWVSDYGTYYANKRQFVPKEGITLENQEEYVKAIKNRVSNYYSISKLIMDNDYYDYILGSE